MTGKAFVSSTDTEKIWVQLFKSSPDGISLSDAETGVILDCNAALAKMIGLKESEIIGHSQSILNLPEDVVESFSKTFSQHRVGRKWESIDTNLVTKTGEVKAVQINVNVVEINERKIVQAIFHDITSRKKLEENQEKFRGLSNAAFEAIFISEDGILLEQNEAARKIFGYSDKEINGRAIADVIAPSHRELAMQHILSRDEEPLTATALRKDGSTFPCIIRGKMMHYQGRTVRVTSLRDIAEREKAEQELQESESLLRKIAANFPNSYISIIEKDMSIGFTAGQEFQKQSIDPQSFVGQHIGDIYGPDADFIISQYQKAFQGEHISFEFYFNQQHQFYQVTPLLNKEQEVERILSIVENITERKQYQQELKEQRDMLATIYQSSPNVMLIVDREARVVSINHAGEQLAGRDKSELLGLLGGEVFNCINSFNGLGCGKNPICKSCSVRSRVEYTFETNESVNLADGEMIIRQGEQDVTIYYLISTVPINIQGEGHVLAILTDITPQKQAEKVLQESEERFRSLYENSTIGIYRTMPDGTILLANPTLVKMLEFDSFEELLSRNLEDIGFGPSYSRDFFLNAIEKNGEVKDLEYIWLTKTGKELMVRESALAIRNNQGETLYYDGVVEDITRRKQVEEALRESQKRATALLEAIPDLVFRIDSQGIFLDFKAERAQLYIQGEDTIIGRNLNEVFPANFASMIHEIIHVTLNSDQIQTFEYQLPMPERGLVDYEARMVRSGENEVTAIIRDISNRKEAEVRIHRYLIELEALYENGLAISRLMEPAEIGQRIVNTFEKHLGWQHVTVRLLKNDGIHLDLIAFNRPGMSNDNREEIKAQFETKVSHIGQGLSGYVVETGEPLRTGQVQAYDQYVETYPGLQSGMYMPLRVAGRSIGCIGVESEQPDAFSEQDERLLMVLSTQTATAFENAYLFNQTRQQLHLQTALTEAGKIIASALDFDTIMANLAEQFGKIIDVTSAYIIRYSMKTREATVIAEYISPNASEKERVSDIGVTYSYLHKTDFEARILAGQHDISHIDDPNLTDIEHDHMILYGAKSILFIPLQIKQQLIGFVEIWESRNKREFSQAEIALCYSLSQQAALALENSSLYQDVQQELAERKQAEANLQKRTRELGLLFRASQLLRQSLDEDIVFATLHDLVSESMDCDNLYVSRFVPEENLIYCKYAWQGETELNINEFPPIPLAQSGGTQSIAIRTGKSLLLNDYNVQRKTGKTSYYIDDEGNLSKEEPVTNENIPQSALIIPLLSNNEVRQVIQIFSYRLNAYTEDDLHLAEAFASQVAAALTNAHLFKAVKDELNERKRAEKSLRESEARYRALFEQSNDAVLLLNTNGRHLAANQRAADLLGYSVDELESISFRETSADVDQSQDVLERLTRGERVPVFERRFLRKNGEIIDTEINVEMVYDDNGNPLHIQSIIRDISDRKRAENIMLARLRLAQYAQSHSLEELLQKTLDEVEEITDSCVGFFHFMQADQKTLHLQTWSTRTQNVFWMAEGKGLHYTVDQAGGWLDAVQTKKPVIHNEYGALANRKGFSEGHVSNTRELIVPILRGEKIVAILGVGNKPQFYTDKDIDAVSTIADLVWDMAENKRAEEELRNSENRLKEAQRLARIGNWTLDLQTNALIWSDEVFHIFELDPQSFAGTYQAFLDLAHPEDREMVESTFQNSLKNKTPYKIEHRLVMPDGSIKYVIESCETTYNEQGIPLISVGTVQDITERKLAENALRESEQQLREAQRVAKLGNYRFDFATQIWESSDVLDEIFGITEDFVRDVDGWEEIIHPSQRSEMIAYFQEHVTAHQKPFDKEYQIICPSDGQEKWVHGMGKLEFDDDGNLISLIGTIQDITTRKTMERELSQSEENYRLVVESIGEGIVSLDLLGNITEVNPAFLNILDVTRDQLLGKNLIQIVPIINIDKKTILTRMKQIIQKGQAGEAELVLSNRRGEDIIIRARYSTIKKDNIVRGITAVVEDITQRKQAEKALHSRTNELEALFVISSHLRTAQSTSQTLSRILQEIRRVLHADTNAIVLLDPDNQHFTPMVSDGVLAKNASTKFKAENSISGLVMQTRQPYISEDFSSDTNNNVSIEGTEKLGPLVVAPILSENEFLGVLVCAREKSKSVRQFAKTDIHLLNAVGEMLGNALRRERLYNQAIYRLQQVQALHSIDLAITANLDLRITMDILLGQITSQMNVDAAAVLLLDPYSHRLEYQAGNGFRSKAIESTNLRIGEGLPGWVALERKSIRTPNLAETDKLSRKYLLDEGFVSYHATPLITKGQLLGVLETFSSSAMSNDDEQKGFLETLAVQAAIAIENAQLFTELQNSNLELSLAYDATIEGWSRALELRDQETEGHALRVTDMTIRLAQAMGMSGKELVNLRRGTLLHDIGKMGIPDEILLKPGALTNSEWEIMHKHPTYAMELLRTIDFLIPAIDIPYCHHEKWDGSGYPRGLKDTQIPLSARIFAIIDVYDALTNDRVYRAAWPHAEAVEYIRKQSGHHFDPHVVEVFLTIIQEFRPD